MTAKRIANLDQPDERLEFNGVIHRLKGTPGERRVSAVRRDPEAAGLT